MKNIAEPEDPDPLGNPHFVYLFNLSEDVWPFIDTLDPAIKAHEVRENALLSGREYLGFRAEHAGQSISLIAPFIPDNDFVDYVDSLIPGKGTIVVPTTPHSGLLSHDLLTDNNTIAQLFSVPTTLVSYSDSPQLYRLIEHLQQSHCPVTTADITSPAAWNIMQELCTKSGFRQLITNLNHKNLYMSPGQVFENLASAVSFASQQLSTHGVVIKTHKGHAGMGVVLLKPEELNGNDPFVCVSQKLLLEGDYWDKFPIVVEDLIPLDISIGGGVPNGEGYIDTDGKVTVNFTCGMRIQNAGVFAGVEVGPAILPASIVAGLEERVHTLGQEYATRGYRGYFDVDCLAGIDGKLYIAESNIRRTGGTYAYHVARFVYGNDFQSHHVIITNIVDIPSQKITFSHLYSELQPLFYHSGQEIGVVLTAPDLLSMGKLAYMVLAENRSQSLELETQFLSQLQTLLQTSPSRHLFAPS